MNRRFGSLFLVVCLWGLLATTASAVEHAFIWGGYGDGTATKWQGTPPSPSAVPEPSMFVLLGLGGLCLAIARQLPGNAGNVNKP